MIRLKNLLIEASTEKVEKQIQFDSGKYSEQDGKLNAQIGPDLEKIKQFLIKHQDGEFVQIRLASSESKVPNRDAATGQPLSAGELSKKRYASIKSYLTKKLQEWFKQGVIKKIPPFVETQPIIGGPEWNPKGGDKSSDEKFKKHQYLWFIVEVKEGAKPEKVTSIDSASSREHSNVYISQAPEGEYTFAYGPNSKWRVKDQSGRVIWQTVGNKLAVPSKMLTNAGKFTLKTDMSSVGGPKPFTWYFAGDANCQLVPGISNYVRIKGASVTCKYCDSYKVFVGRSAPTLEQWQYIYMYIKKEERVYGHKDWSFISNKPADLEPNLRLNGSPGSPGYSTDTRSYYY
jgi:hypothetical protein